MWTCFYSEVATGAAAESLNDYGNDQIFSKRLKGEVTFHFNDLNPHRL